MGATRGAAWACKCSASLTDYPAPHGQWALCPSGYSRIIEVGGYPPMQRGTFKAILRL